VKELEARYVRNFKRGEVVFREGDAGHTMYVLRAGRVRISRSVRGRETTFALLGPGDFFGEMAILTGRPRNATATVVEDAAALELDAARFEAMLQSEPHISARIMQRLCERVDAGDHRIAILLKRDVRARVLLALMDEVRERGFPSPTPEHVLIQADLDALSDAIGVKRSELDEVVARLTRVGLGRSVEGGLELSSLPKLNEFLSFLEERGIVKD
jgi:CRP/FNR family transcriptional regulator, cyclic AMP receptor protein